MKERNKKILAMINYPRTFFVYLCVLSSSQKDLIKKHRIYLLRDDIRVLPYGDPDDDWLQIDIGRGTISAGSFFSNDQVVGRIKITKAGNPHLKDKTNREGLIEDEYYTSDFICVIRSLLSFLRIEDYKEYLKNEKNKKDIAKINTVLTERKIAEAKA